MGTKDHQEEAIATVPTREPGLTRGHAVRDVSENLDRRRPVGAERRRTSLRWPQYIWEELTV
jgi:hypothetical protein